jgi:ADP-ribosylglycohydrolase
MSRWVDPSQSIAGAVLAASVGDALGAPFEFSPEFGGLVADGPVTDYQPRIRHEPGSYSGGSELLLIQTSAIVNTAHRWQEDTGHRLSRWVVQGARAGLTTQAAVVRLRSGKPWTESGIEKGPQGTAGLLRSAAAALVSTDDPRHAADLAREACLITHRWRESLSAARTLGYCLAALVSDPLLHPHDALIDGCGLAGPGQMGQLVRRALELAEGDVADDVAVLELGKSSHVHEAFPTAVYFAVKYAGDVPTALSHCAWRTSQGDTDSICFLAGLIAGATVGVAGIPSPWLSDLTRRELLQRAALKLHLAKGIRTQGDV